MFAWTQTRLQLPVWLGVGAALKAEIDAGNLEMLQQMYQVRTTNRLPKMTLNCYIGQPCAVCLVDYSPRPLTA